VNAGRLEQLFDQRERRRFVLDRAGANADG